MTLNSIQMLRHYNKKVKVRVFLIGGIGKDRFEQMSKTLDFELVHRQPTKEAKDHNLFLLNRQYLGECEEESVLYIDGDTFIFGDVETLFERYKDYDFAGAIDVSVSFSEDWDKGDAEASFRMFGSETQDIFNGGLTLWNNNVLKGWAGEFFVPTCLRLLDERDVPVCKWLWSGTRNGYLSETLTIAFYVGGKKLKYRVMEDKDVINLFSWDAIKRWCERDFIVFHSFAQHWTTLYRTLREQKSNFKLTGKPLLRL